MPPPPEESGGEKKRPQLARTVKDKWRSKVWYKVKAPALFQGVDLGETCSTTPEGLEGRTLETTLGELSGGGEASKAHIKLKFRMVAVQEGDKVVQTRFIGHELTSDYIRRLARRKRSKIDTSLKVVTKDGVEIVLKPVAVSEHRLQARLRSRLRVRLREVLVEAAQQRTASEFVRDMLNGELAKTIANGVRQLYPLKKIEIRASSVKGPIPDSGAVVTEGPSPPVEAPSAPEVIAEPAAAPPA